MEEACNKFRNYLQSSGTAEALTASLTSLYRLKKWPESPVEFIRQHLPPVQEETISGLTKELEDLNQDIAKIQKMIPVEKIPDRRLDTVDEIVTEIEQNPDTIGDDIGLESMQGNAKEGDSVQNPEEVQEQATTSEPQEEKGEQNITEDETNASEHQRMIEDPNENKQSPEAKTEETPETTIEVVPTDKAEHSSEHSPEVKTVTEPKSENISEVKQESELELKAEAQIEHSTEDKPEDIAESELEVQPKVDSEFMPEPMTEINTESNTELTEVKTESKPDIKED